MLKFFIISAVIWFVIIKILRFKFVVIKNSENQNYKQNRKEGYISVNKNSGKNQNIKGDNNGEYVDYEEVK